MYARFDVGLDLKPLRFPQRWQIKQLGERYKHLPLVKDCVSVFLLDSIWGNYLHEGFIVTDCLEPFLEHFQQIVPIKGLVINPPCSVDSLPVRCDPSGRYCRLVSQ